MKSDDDMPIHIPRFPVPLIYLASITDRSRTWFYGQARYGRILTVKCDGIILIPYDEVCRLIESGRITLDPSKLPASPEDNA